MLDLELIRKDRTTIEGALAKRMDPVRVAAAFDEILELDQRRRSLLRSIEDERRRRKAEAREYAEAKRSGLTPAEPNAEDRQTVARMEDDLTQVEGALFERMSELPNIPADDVVPGGKENNRVIKVHGQKPNLDNPLDHVTIADRYGLVDFERGVKLGGSGYWIYKGLGARLEWALVDWFIEQHVAAGYTFMLPPHLLLESAGFAAGQFPKFYEDVYHIETNEARGQFLLPTAETAILGAYQNEIVPTNELPIKAFAYTPCYRRERAGSHSDERGTVRGHQFNKVEIFQFVEPEHAEAVLEEMVEHVESLVEGLGLHYQRSLLAADDASASMRKTIDIEVWIPSVGKYKEVSSVSWAGDYQARRAGIRYRAAGVKSPTFLHTLNGSALATSRVFPAVLEQCQQADGSIQIPKVLQSRVGVERIEAPQAPGKRRRN